jgi:hypothetical protein
MPRLETKAFQLTCPVMRLFGRWINSFTTPVVRKLQNALARAAGSKSRGRAGLSRIIWGCFVRGPPFAFALFGSLLQIRSCYLIVWAF